MEIGADNKLAQEILKNAPVGEPFIKMIAAKGEKHLPALLFCFTVLSIISTVGRSDFNVALAISGMFFFKSFTDREKQWFLSALVCSILFDFIWLGAESDVKGMVNGNGLHFTLAPRTISLIVTSVNIVIKFPMCIFLYASTQQIRNDRELATFEESERLTDVKTNH